MLHACDRPLARARTRLTTRAQQLRLHGGGRRDHRRHQAADLVIASPAAWADPQARADIERVTTLLRAAESGAQHLLLTIVVPTARLADLTPLLPARWWQLPDAATATTVVQGAFDRSTIAEALTQLVEAGAVQIVETPIGKLVSA
jgi:ATP phosphoribosyltransferase